MSDTSNNAKKSVYIIDGHAQIFRAYHAIRSLSSPVTKEPTNATFGFVGMLLKLFAQRNPDYVIATFDISGDTEGFRSTIYPEYKTNRSPTPDDLPPQTERIKEICTMWGIPVLGVEGVEADDVIATLCTHLKDQTDLEIFIVSRDKDLEQLISDQVRMYDVHKDILMTPELLEEKKGIKPEQVGDMLTLMGDNVDNIPGVKGVGPKTAAKLIKQYGSLDALVENVEELSGKLKENLIAGIEMFDITRQLVALKTDVPFDFELNQAHVEPPPVDDLRSMFKQLGFTRHIRDLENLANPDSQTETTTTTTDTAKPAQRKPTKPDPVEEGGLFGAMFEDADPAEVKTSVNPDLYSAITTQKQLDTLVKQLKKIQKAAQPLAVDTETSQLNPMQARLCGICLSWETEQGVYIPTHSADDTQHLDQTTVINALKPFLEDDKILKVGQNLKYDMLILRRAGINLHGPFFDTMVASYLLDSTRSSHKLDYLALSYLDYEMLPISALIGTGKKQRSMASLTYDQITTYAAEDADITLRLYELFNPMLKQADMTELSQTLEMPLVEVLGELEFNGILVDGDELDKQKRALEKRIGDLHDEILKAADEDFNPDSSRQLADVLFNKLKCKVIKRGKTGPSTDVEVLTRISEEQEAPGSIVAALVLEYRQLTKLRNTYMDSLKDAIDPDTHRIHASFNQTVTATGRLSSSDPNLQNIPIRTDLGRQIRKAFIAPEKHFLLSADYSQIELRMLAHLAEDEALIKAFNDGLDIHQAVASEVFDTPLDQVTPDQRASAKMVNFGIVYGITPWGLARRLPSDAEGSSVDVAKQIIADYKAKYPKIDAFLDACIAKAETDGHVETIAKRRRLVPEVNSNQANTVAFGHRIAINTVVQGSAADLIKMAMVRLHQRIQSESLPMKMLLQIHDELVFEIPQNKLKPMTSLIIKEMESAMDLRVPLKVEVSAGKDWFEAK